MKLKLLQFDIIYYFNAKLLFHMENNMLHARNHNKAFKVIVIRNMELMAMYHGLLLATCVHPAATCTNIVKSVLYISEAFTNISFA